MYFIAINFNIKSDQFDFYLHWPGCRHNMRRAPSRWRSLDIFVCFKLFTGSRFLFIIFFSLATEQDISPKKKQILFFLLLLFYLFTGGNHTLSTTGSNEVISDLPSISQLHVSERSGPSSRQSNEVKSPIDASCLWFGTRGNEGNTLRYIICT